jgi:F-type H+-transporting ATPase subunit b
MYLLPLAFDVIKPDPGLLVWTTIIFLLVYFFVGRSAFKPIQTALRKRNEEIQDSIDEAKRVQAEMAQLKADNQQLLAEAREERTRIVGEAEKQAKQMVEDAKNEAKAAAQKVAADAKRDIENMRKSAMVDLKKEVGTMAIEIAEKVLQKELKSDANQEAFVKDLVKNLN